jgi:hypothetical protein
MSNENLSPCPFCGDPSPRTSSGMNFVTCQPCMGMDAWIPIDRWNTRTPEGDSQ